MHLVNTEKKKREKMLLFYFNITLCLGTKSNTSVCACVCVCWWCASARNEREGEEESKSFLLGGKLGIHCQSVNTELHNFQAQFNIFFKQTKWYNYKMLTKVLGQ